MLYQGVIGEQDFGAPFDIVLANINKNVLLDELKIYATYLQPKGQILLSGFYTHDIPDLLKEASHYNLTEVTRDERETWASLLLKN